MEDFLNVNTGLSRRIPNLLQFNDYTPMELSKKSSTKFYTLMK